MADTDFTAQETKILAAWLNAVNVATYRANTGITGVTSNRTALAKHADIVSLKDFGAVGDGTTDNTTALQAALDSGAKALYAPAGTYLSSTLTVPSSIMIYGDGPGLTIFKIKNSTNGNLFGVSAKSNVGFRDFSISGNSANQSSGSGIAVSSTSTDIYCDNVVVDDIYDYGFSFLQGTRIRVTNCGATTGRAGADANSVRAGFLFGASGSATAADDVEATNCYVTSATSFRNGFMSDYGSNHRIVGCRTAVAYTGFKIRGHDVTTTGCYATGGVVGFQTQTNSRNLLFQGNIAYRTGDSGFFLGNASAGTTAYGWIFDGNAGIECGQAPSSTSYAFAFEGTAACTVDRLVITNNIALDNGAATQSRGISFGTNGTFSNVFLAGNICKGNTADMVLGASLQTTTLICGFNLATAGTSSVAGSYPNQVYRLAFSVENLAQNATTALTPQGAAARGFVMPAAGYVRRLYVKGNAACTQASCTFRLLKNAVAMLFDALIDTTDTTTDTQEDVLFLFTFAAGDLLTVSAVAAATFEPTGSTDYDVVVEVVY